MGRTETVIFTNMCMVTDGEGKVLVQDRVDPDWQGVAFPGGHVERGESFTDAVIREVYEETGLTVSRLTLCGIKDWTRDDGTRYMVLCYKTGSFSGKLTSSDEGEVRWVPLRELPEMRLAEGMENVLRLFMEDGLSEQFFYKQNDQWVEVLK